jgi:hypothetical protein
VKITRHSRSTEPLQMQDLCFSRPNPL